MMRALTIFQPWAHLIMIGAKPYEFRRWNYLQRQRGLEGQRIVIHASARPVRPAEVEDIIGRVEDPVLSLRAEIALPLLTRIRDAYKARGLVQSAGLGTAILGKPIHAWALFNSPADRYRIFADDHIWAWPLTDIRPFSRPIPCRGGQGFWTWPVKDGLPDWDDLRGGAPDATGALTSVTVGSAKGCPRNDEAARTKDNPRDH
jgi:hypothetical protein